MKISYTKALLLTALLSSSSVALADSNNGYTTAANVYSGSSSRGWYGGGVAHVLAEWKKEKAMAAATPAPVEPATAKEPAPVPASEEPTENTDSTSG
jgi:hypothetical protein